MCRFLNNLVVSFLMLIMSVSHTLAQDSTSLKELTTTYNLLRLDTDYSIIYDNPNAAAKLNAFKIKFYNETEYVGETKEEFFPLTDCRF